MLFNSLAYLLFLVGVVPIYWALPHPARRLFLLAASLLFYCWWKWQYGILFYASIVLNFLLAQLVYARPNRFTRALPILLNLGILGYFKYLGFFSTALNDLSDLLAGTRPVPLVDVLLPIGISFYTFQAMSYVIDVARGHRAPERNLLTFSLFISFWPQLVAGPIVRYGELVGQLESPRTFRYEEFARGLQRILFGLFLKVVLADELSSWVEEGFRETNIPRNSGIDNWTLAFAFGFQIYFDFAGYSAIAVGSAALLGFRLPENFNFPYVAASPREFWQRWHISLSTWIRDYLYVPLQRLLARSSPSPDEGNAADRRPGGAASVMSLLLTWAAMGLWHGANWTFLCWGLWHALLVILYRLVRGRTSPAVGGPDSPSSPALLRLAGVMFTLPLVMAGWVFFRAPTVAHAVTMLRTMFNPFALGGMSYKENLYLAAFLLTAGFFGVFGLVQGARRWAGSRAWRGLVWIPQAALYAGMTFAVAGFLRGKQQFIYFQF